jgi:hypothetical protein
MLDYLRYVYSVFFSLFFTDENYNRICSANYGELSVFYFQYTTSNVNFKPFFDARHPNVDRKFIHFVLYTFV